MALSDWDKDALKSFQPKLKGGQTGGKGNREGGWEGRGDKVNEGETSMIIGKPNSDDWCQWVLKINMFKGIFSEWGRGDCLSLIEVHFVKGYKVEGRECECVPDGV